MGVKLTEKKLVTAMNPDQTFLIVVDGALCRLSLSDLQKMMGNNIFYPTITLEQSSNPKFDLPTPFMASMYQKAMGGYMMKVVNGKAYVAKLSPSNWEFFADGTQVDDASKYETMVHVPDCHFKADNKTLQFGGLFPISGGKTFDSPNWVGAYKISYDGSGVAHSRPNIAPMHTQTISQFFAAAQELGSNFGLANYGFQCLIEALYQVSFGDLDSQSVIGAGFNGSLEKCRDVPMGKCISLGDGSGKVLYNDATIGNQYPVKLFGFEDLWNKLWELRQGIRFYMDGDTKYAVVYSGNRVSNTADGRKFTVPSSTIQGGYITNNTLGTYWDAIPQAVGGSSVTYYCDSFWSMGSGEIISFGGDSVAGVQGGLSSVRSQLSFSELGGFIGARLAFYGNPTIVSGSELMAM